MAKACLSVPGKIVWEKCHFNCGTMSAFADEQGPKIVKWALQTWIFMIEIQATPWALRLCLGQLFLSPGSLRRKHLSQPHSRSSLQGCCRKKQPVWRVWHWQLRNWWRGEELVCIAWAHSKTLIHSNTSLHLGLCRTPVYQKAFWTTRSLHRGGTAFVQDSLPQSIISFRTQKTAIWWFRAGISIESQVQKGWLLISWGRAIWWENVRGCSEERHWTDVPFTAAQTWWPGQIRLHTRYGFWQ